MLNPSRTLTATVESNTLTRIDKLFDWIKTSFWMFRLKNRTSPVPLDQQQTVCIWFHPKLNWSWIRSVWIGCFSVFSLFLLGCLWLSRMCLYRQSLAIAKISKISNLSTFVFKFLIFFQENKLNNRPLVFTCDYQIRMIFMHFGIFFQNCLVRE